MKWILIVLILESSDGGTTVQTERLTTKTDCENVGAAIQAAHKKVSERRWSSDIAWSCVELKRD